MAALLEVERPNIRIEIENNVVDEEKMEVDEDQLLEENEEGEIVDDEGVDMRKNLQISIQTQPFTVERVHPNTKAVFTTGINIFDKEEQKKLQERARRFALKPEEIKSFTEADLAELYESLGINSKNEIENRFDAVHMIGIAGMSAEDILEYFAKYAPLSIEWIDQNSCNVVWLENITAARAMFYTSKAVNGMPAREAVDTFAKEFLDDVEEAESGESILVKKQKGHELNITDILPHKVNIEGGVDMSQITISIPPGYWRLGEPHPKTKCLLMRYSLRSDMKPYKTEDLAWYYKKLGVERKRRENKGIFERNRNLTQDKNPWGSLARNWDNDVHCEPEPEKDTPKINIKNPHLLVRLGKKKSPSLEDAEEIERAEDVEDFSEKTMKLPRMRMYADEEEERQRRKRLLRTLKKQSDELLKENHSRITDLRSMLNMSDIVKRIPPKEIIVLDPPETVDLNTRVRQNAERMVVTVKRDLNEERNVVEDRGNRDTAVRHRREDARKIISSAKSATLSSQTVHRRRRSPIVYDRGSPSSPRNDRRDISRSPIRKDASMRRYTSSGRRSPQNATTHRSSYHQDRPSRMMMYSDRSQRTNSSSYWIRPPRRSAYLSRKGTLHSDRISSQRSQRHDDDYHGYYGSIEKPRSKVAVVIKKRKVPTVRSIVLPRVRKSSASQESESESSESDSSESSESSSSSDSESESSDSESESESGSDSESVESDKPRKRKL
nr:unnamed protein product [Callosobruchus analis]